MSGNEDDDLLTSLTDAAINNLSQLAALQEQCESQQQQQTTPTINRNPHQTIEPPNNPLLQSDPQRQTTTSAHQLHQSNQAHDQEQSIASAIAAAAVAAAAATSNQEQSLNQHQFLHQHQLNHLNLHSQPHSKLLQHQQPQQQQQQHQQRYHQPPDPHHLRQSFSAGQAAGSISPHQRSLVSPEIYQLLHQTHQYTSPSPSSSINNNNSNYNLRHPKANHQQSNTKQHQHQTPSPLLSSNQQQQNIVTSSTPTSSPLILSSFLSSARGSCLLDQGQHGHTSSPLSSNQSASSGLCSALSQASTSALSSGSSSRRAGSAASWSNNNASGLMSPLSHSPHLSANINSNSNSNTNSRRPYTAISSDSRFAPTSSSQSVYSTLSSASPSPIGPNFTSPNQQTTSTPNNNINNANISSNVSSNSLNYIIQHQQHASLGGQNVNSPLGVGNILSSPLASHLQHHHQHLQHQSSSISASTSSLDSISALAASIASVAAASNQTTSGQNALASLSSQQAANSSSQPIGSSASNSANSISQLISNKNSLQARLNNMQIRHKYGYLGPHKGQFNSPHGFCLGLNQEIVVADTNNHRVCIFDKSGTFLSQFGEPGKEDGQLWNPRKVAILHNHNNNSINSIRYQNNNNNSLSAASTKTTPPTTQQNNTITTSTRADLNNNNSNNISTYLNNNEPIYVVCDRGSERSRMQLFTKDGVFIKKIGIHYIDIVAGLAITQNGLIIVVDSVSPTVYIINGYSGILDNWFDCSNYMKEPSDIAVKNNNMNNSSSNQLISSTAANSTTNSTTQDLHNSAYSNEYFICDFKGHCVVVFSETGEFLRKIGHDGLTSYPNGIDISDDGDILVGDSHGNRFHVVVFDRNGTFVSQFECPHVKVSRCCGLKITREGYIVTLAKNNHHVLVLDTIHI